MHISLLVPYLSHSGSCWITDRLVCACVFRPVHFVGNSVTLHCAMLLSAGIYCNDVILGSAALQFKDFPMAGAMFLSILWLCVAVSAGQRLCPM